MISGTDPNQSNYYLYSDKAQKTSSKEIQELSKEQIEDIDKILDAKYKSDEPGCTYAIMQEGKIIWERAIGTAEPGINRTTAMRQHIGSASKQFTALCVALLVDRGLIKLEDDIHDCIPSMRNMPPFRGPDGNPVVITVKDLLHMQSGLPNNTIAQFNGFSDQDLNDGQMMGLITNYLKRNPILASEPGKKYVYCNTNYSLLAELVSAKSNQPFRDFAKSEIFDKLEMTDSGFIAPEGTDQMLKGYRKKGDDWEDCTTRNCTVGPCGVIATAADMAKWDGYFANPTLGKNHKHVLELIRGPDQPPTDLKNAWEEQPFKDAQYLGGLCVGLSPHGEFALEAHSGEIDGFETYIIRARPIKSNEKPLTVFIACNRDSSSNKDGVDAGDIAVSILEKCLKTNILTLKDQPKTAAIEKTDSISLNHIEGLYHNPISGSTCELKIKNNELHLMIPPAEEAFFTFKPSENPHIFRGSKGGFIEFKDGNFTLDDEQTFRNLIFKKSF